MVSLGFLLLDVACLFGHVDRTHLGKTTLSQAFVHCHDPLQMGTAGQALKQVRGYPYTFICYFEEC